MPMQTSKNVWKKIGTNLSETKRLQNSKKQIEPTANRKTSHLMRPKTCSTEHWPEKHRSIAASRVVQTFQKYELLNNVLELRLPALRCIATGCLN